MKVKAKCIRDNDSMYLKLGEIYEAIHNPAEQSFTLTFGGVDYFYSGDRFTIVTDDVEPVEPVADPAGGWSNAHYDFDYKLTEDDIKRGTIRLDPYRVAHQWRLGKKDDSGVLFHCLKTLARFGDKNPREREIIAIYAQIKRMAELEGVTLK